MLGARVTLDDGTEATVIAARRIGKDLFKLRVIPDDLNRRPRWIGPVSYAKG